MYAQFYSIHYFTDFIFISCAVEEPIREVKVSHLIDGSLTLEYPFNMAVALETTPHPVLSTEHPLMTRRRVLLPNNLTHSVEWRYTAMRKGKVIEKLGRKLRVGKPASSSSSSPPQHDVRFPRHGETPVSNHSQRWEGKILAVC